MLRGLLKLVFFGLAAIAASGCGGGQAGSGLPLTPSTAGAAAPVTINPVIAPGTSIAGLSATFSTAPLGSVPAGWHTSSGTWSICQNGISNAYCQTSLNDGESFNGAAWWSDYTISAQVIDTNVGFGGAGIIGRATSSSQYYLLELRPQINGSLPYWYLLKRSSSPSVILASGPLHAPDKNPTYGLRLTFAGSRITASIAFDGSQNYQVLGTATDSSYPTGQIGLYTWVSAARSFQSVNVSVAGESLPSEIAASSSSFVDTMGMNGHFESPFYYANLPLERSLVGNLGVRYYRVSAEEILQPIGDYVGNIKSLCTSYGTKFDILTSFHLTAAQVVKAVGLLPASCVDSVEGPNESDNSGQGSEYDPHYATDIPPYMHSLYSTIKATPATAFVNVIGPSFAYYTSYAAIGNISSSVDFGNMHNYFSGFSPGTPGWGAGNLSFAQTLQYGSIAWNLAVSMQATGTKPVMATETGYYTAPIHCGVPLDVQAKYIPRLYLEQYRYGVPRTFLYQLIGYNTTSADGSLGIVSSTGAPLPAYTALAGMISALKDNGIKSAPASYNWGLTGETTNVTHVLLHKADGTLMIPLWIEVPSFDPNANKGVGAKISVPVQTVAVNLPTTTRNATLLTYNPVTGAWTSSPVAVAGGTATITVSDAVSILEVPPS
jgi:hypothetical protein